jgi:putative transposase
MRLFDEQYTRTPFYGKRKMVKFLHDESHVVDHKRVRRLMQRMGLETIYPQTHLSQVGVPPLHYLYLLQGVTIERINQVWSSPITYIRPTQRFVHRVAIIDWFNRFVLVWKLSTKLDTSFCSEALDQALRTAFSIRIKGSGLRARSLLRA